MAFRRDVDHDQRVGRVDMGTARPSTDRAELLAHLARLSPGQRFDAKASDRELAFRVWVAIGRSIHELVPDPAAGAISAFSSRSDSYIVSRVVHTARPKGTS